MSVKKLMDEAFAHMDRAMDSMREAMKGLRGAVEITSSENWNGEAGLTYVESDQDGNVVVKGTVSSLRVNGFTIRMPQHVLKPRVGAMREEAEPS